MTIRYILPFLLFALITYLGPFLGLSPLVVYPCKTLVVGACLIWFRNTYKKEITLKMDWPALLAGIFVFAAWVGLEGYYPQLGSQTLPQPPTFASGTAYLFFIFFRFLGAVLVVPVMEELFWRSFALRFLIETKFTSVPLGTFTWFSFIVVSLAFGLEHHRWLPGIIAGLVYALLLYRTRNLFSPILSHAVTNFLLGAYVLSTGNWQFW